MKRKKVFLLHFFLSLLAFTTLKKYAPHKIKILNCKIPILFHEINYDKMTTHVKIVLPENLL